MISKLDFFRFLKTPTKHFKGDFLKDFYVFLAIFSLHIVVLSIKHIVTNQPLVEDKDLEDLVLSQVFMIVLFLPFIEELFFRGFIKFKQKYILVLSFLSYIILSYSFIKNENIKMFVIPLILVIGCLLMVNKRAYEGSLKLITKNFRFLIYFSSFFFSIIHFSNYSNFEFVNILVILQKFFGGLFLAFVVTKYNIWYGLFFHALNNIIPFLVIYAYSLL